jgi:hypothetical protein
MRPHLAWFAWLSLAACDDAKRSDGVPLAEVSDPAFGYAISVPTAARQLEKEEWRHVWSWSPDRGVNSYTCIVEPARGLGEFTADAARARVASVRASEGITRVAALGDDGLVVDLAEDDLVHYRESWGFRRGRTRTMIAICTGPARGDTVRAMAASLRVLE